MPRIQLIADSNNTYDNYKSSRLQQTKQQNNLLRQSKSQVIPIYQVAYNPEYSKSPLALHTIQTQSPNRKMQRNLPIRQYQIEHENHIQQINQLDQLGYSSQTQSKPTFKVCLYRIIGCAMLIGTFIGLYFLVDAILGKKQHNGQASSPDIQDGTYNPIDIKAEAIVSQPYYIPSNGKQNWGQKNNQNQLNRSIAQAKVTPDSIAPIDVYAPKAK